jgi:hypothetical protein
LLFVVVALLRFFHVVVMEIEGEVDLMQASASNVTRVGKKVAHSALDLVEGFLREGSLFLWTHGVGSLVGGLASAAHAFVVDIIWWLDGAIGVVLYLTIELSRVAFYLVERPMSLFILWWVLPYLLGGFGLVWAYFYSWFKREKFANAYIVRLSELISRHDIGTDVESPEIRAVIVELNNQRAEAGRLGLLSKDAETGSEMSVGVGWSYVRILHETVHALRADLGTPKHTVDNLSLAYRKAQEYLREHYKMRAGEAFDPTNPDHCKRQLRMSVLNSIARDARDCTFVIIEHERQSQALMASAALQVNRGRSWLSALRGGEPGVSLW